MTARHFLLNPAIHSIIALIAVGVAYALGGEKGLIGMTLGLFGTGFNLWAMWKVIVLIGKASEVGRPQRVGATLTALAFLVKLPLFVALGIVAQRLGGAAPGCFLGGLGLVYSALIGWSLIRD